MTECPGCGLVLARSPSAADLPAGLRASRECRVRYDQLACYTLTLGDAEFVHQLIVDAYTAQHACAATKPIAIVFAVVGMYLVHEHGYTGRQVQLAHMRMAATRRTWPQLLLPTVRAGLTVAEAHSEPADGIFRWSAAVWSTWTPQREAIAALAHRHGAIMWGLLRTGVGAFDRRQPAEHVPIADDNELPRLTIAGAAGPSGNFEDVSQQLFRQRVRPKLTNCA